MDPDPPFDFDADLDPDPAFYSDADPSRLPKMTRTRIRPVTLFKKYYKGTKSNLKISSCNSTVEVMIQKIF